MPRTSNPPIRCHNALFQWRPVVRAPGTHGVELVVEVDDEDLSPFDTVDVGLGFLHVGDVGEGGEVFEAVFWHGWSCGEGTGSTR